MLASDETAFDKVLALQETHKVTLDICICRFQMNHFKFVFCSEFLKVARRGNFALKDAGRKKIRAGLTHLLAAVESLTFLPSKEAKCCSRASRRLLGACRDRKHIVSRFLRFRTFSMHGNQDNRGQWWATKIGEETLKAMKKKIQVHVLDLEVLVCLKTLGYWLPTTDHSLHSSPNKATLGERNMCVGWPTAPRHFQQFWILLNQPCLSTTGAAIIYSQ